jgi:catechol 2,3-dioxygenase-like lactoylglutathione lyase family enzyme
MSVRFQSAVIFVRDMAASRRFYEELLGQTVSADFGPNVGFEGGFALWQVAHACEIVYGRAPESDSALGRDNLELYFETGDLDAAWKQLEEHGIRAVHPIVEQPWGQRVLRVADPDGHVVELGEPVPVFVQRFLAQGLTVEQTAERTGIPLAFVQQIAGAQPAQEGS